MDFGSLGSGFIGFLIGLMLGSRCSREHASGYEEGMKEACREWLQRQNDPTYEFSDTMKQAIHAVNTGHTE